jgi:hypothetical protein
MIRNTKYDVQRALFNHPYRIGKDTTNQGGGKIEMEFGISEKYFFAVDARRTPIAHQISFPQTNYYFPIVELV